MVSHDSARDYDSQMISNRRFSRAFYCTPPIKK
jgi:hypothetical protein